MKRVKSVELGQILPVKPLLSSRARDWRGILVERYRHEAGETHAPLLANHLLTLNLSGAYRLTQKLTNRTSENQIAPNFFNLTAAGRETFWRWDEPVEALHLQIEPWFLEQVAVQINESQNAGTELLPLSCGADVEIEFLGKRLLHELETESFGTRLYIESLTNLLAVHLLRCYAATKRDAQNAADKLAPRALRLAIDYIDGHLEQDISLAELAAQTGMSQFHFARAFRQSTGLPPHQFLIRRRVEQAKKLLRDNKLSIADIAFACGFSSQSHLNRHFKRLVGTTPKQYATR